MVRSDLVMGLIKNRYNAVGFKKYLIHIADYAKKKGNHTFANMVTSNITEAPQEVDEKTMGLFHNKIPELRLDDLFLPYSAKEQLLELAEEQRQSVLLYENNVRPRNRLLLTGPPGNGKTAAAEAMATELCYPLLVIRYETLIGSYLGQTASRFNDVIEYARTRHCVLFIDEFETVCKERSDENETGEMKRVVSSFLLQLDSLPTNVVVIEATNHPESLDRAVLRRFQITINLPPPDVFQIESFMTRFMKTHKVDFGLSLYEISSELLGTSFAEVEEFCFSILRTIIISKVINKNNSLIAKKKLLQFKERKRII